MAIFYEIKSNLIKLDLVHFCFWPSKYASMLQFAYTTLFDMCYNAPHTPQCALYMLQWSANAKLMHDVLTSLLNYTAIISADDL